MGHDDGMTLVEMLVVLAIVGVMSGATVLAMGHSAREDLLRAESQRLVARLNTAADEVMVSNRRVVLEWDPAGYGFAPLTEKTPQRGQSELRRQSRYTLPAGIRLQADRSPVPVDPDLARAPIALRLVASGKETLIVFDGFEATVSGAAR
jgi:general secretion pathway protein H